MLENLKKGDMVKLSNGLVVTFTGSYYWYEAMKTLYYFHISGDSVERVFCFDESGKGVIDREEVVKILTRGR